MKNSMSDNLFILCQIEQGNIYFMFVIGLEYDFFNFQIDNIKDAILKFY